MLFDPPFPSTLLAPTTFIIFRYSALSLAFSEAAAVFAFDGVALIEERRMRHTFLLMRISLLTFDDRNRH